jgi:hypothetical protein
MFGRTQLIINHDLNDIVDVHELQLFLLLYADDSDIFGTSKESVQAMLNDLNNYGCTCGLTVDTAKTKIMIFVMAEKLMHVFVMTRLCLMLLILLIIWELHCSRMNDGIEIL